jgi:16S rRNA (cytosine1402-N4)-methyltransferase
VIESNELATDAEIDENPRAKPVRLRAAERLRRPA